MNKSKVTRNKHAKYDHFSLGNETLEEEAKEHNYLGQMVTAEPNPEKEFRRRIGKGWGALGKHSQTMKNKLRLSLKRKNVAAA